MTKEIVDRLFSKNSQKTWTSSLEENKKGSPLYLAELV